MMNDFLTTDLNVLEQEHRYRQLREVESPMGRVIIRDGKEVLNFCSNDYLGLANDPRLIVAAQQGLTRYGVGSGASRLVSGHMTAHAILEHNIAQLKSTEAALVFSTGYMANCGIISALVDRDDVVFSDRLNHASIIDGVILSRAKLERYPHVDMKALEDLLKGTPITKRKLIVTDSVFSMDGDCAPLHELVILAKKYKAMLMVDEAHGFGVLGKNGAGLVDQLGLQQDVGIQMGTLSKAAGCFGAYVAGSTSLIHYLINHARSFIYTTALPPAIAEAANCAIDIIRENQEQRTQLIDNATYLRLQLNALGFNTLQSTTPIIPIIVGDAQRAVALSQRLLEKGIFVQAIRPPTVPEGSSRLRVTVMATHTREDLDYFIQCMKVHTL